ncbi:MAG: NUDIX domain-containing protein [Oceanospirillales bacterium]|nr:NUDIX domain-containing protein [Oceanospirillales bacterium]
MFELLLLRHGEAKDEPAVPDIERPLKGKGKRGAQRLGVWMHEHSVAPEVVIASPAERARTTAEKCIKAMGRSAENIRIDSRLYGADAKTLLDIAIENTSYTNRLMLVGHNPALARLIELLLPYSAIPNRAPLLPAGTLVRIGLPENRAMPLRGQGKLLSWTEPGDLPKLFPVRIDGALEQRKRPAYYYSQSAVIPYRFIDGEVQMLLITSSSGRWWGVPKGIVEPGLSEQDSAAKEAMEEAGVLGDVHPTRMGHYLHEKWGATCDVSVYAMRVDSILPESEWDEDHRIRRWTTTDQSIDSIKSTGLKTIVQELPAFLKQEGLWQD